MKKYITNLILLGVLVSLGVFSSCNKQKEIPDCGALIEHSVNRKYCIKMELPVSEFTVTYPEQLVMKRQRTELRNIDYVNFMKIDEDGIQTEKISMGGSTIHRNTSLKKMLYKQILAQAKSVALKAGFKLTEEFSGKRVFDGIEYDMFQAIGEIDRPEDKFVGEYLILCLIVESDVDNKNGTFVTMMANEDSNIESFEDFANYGCISTVWKSLHFNYENSKKSRYEIKKTVESE